MTMFTQRETRILDQAREIISRCYHQGFSSAPLMMCDGV